MKKKIFIILKVSLGVLGFLIWWRLISAETLSFGAQEIPKTNNWTIIFYGYFITILGVLLGSAYRDLQRRKAEGQKNIDKYFFKNIITSIDLWMSLLGSPLVYALLWKSLEGGTIASLTIVALQNGFCCTVIISNIIKNKESEITNINDNQPIVKD